MEFQTTLHPEWGLLYVNYAGVFTLEEAKRIFLLTLDAVVEKKAQKVLVDGRAVAGELTTLERYLYAEFAASETFRRCSGIALPVPRFAYLLRVPVLDPQRLGETVAVNRGMAVRAFDDPQSALHWLGLDPAHAGWIGGGAGASAAGISH